MSFKKYNKIGEIDFEKYSISCLTDYLELLKSINLNPDSRWFRGQPLADYRLVPSGLRDAHAIKDKFGNNIEPHSISFCDDSRSEECVFLDVDQMVNDFMLEAESSLDYKVKNNLQWECIAQHYGLPTRMLDWTTNPLDALYFAINSNEKFEKESIGNACKDFEKNGGFSSKGAAVFVLDPVEANKQSISFEKELKCEPCVLDTIKHYKYIKYRMNMLFSPICIKGVINEKRICRQSGNFTVFGTYLLALDFYNIFQNMLIKVFIPSCVFDNINKDLKALGITKESIYLGKDKKEKIAENIKNRARKKFYKSLGFDLHSDI